MKTNNKRAKLVMAVTGLLLIPALLLAAPMMKMDKHTMMMRMMDSNKDGKISMTEWTAHFKEMDHNSDGFVTAAEMQAHHKKHMQMHGKKEMKHGKHGMH